MDSRKAVRSWISVTAVIACGNAHAAWNEKSVKKFFENSEASEMFGRLFGLWNLFLALLRFATTANFDIKALHWITISTYCISLVHLLTEAFIFKTANPLSMAVLINLFMSVFSLLLIAWCWNKIWNPTLTREEREKIIRNQQTFDKFVFSTQRQKKKRN